jgi:PAS domain S-box-containing protein
MGNAAPTAVELTAPERDLLRVLQPVLAARGPAIVDAFFAELSQIPETAALLEDPRTIDRLKQVHQEYLLSLTAHTDPDAARAHRVRMGQSHERAGLPPRWFLFAYSVYFQLLAPLIQQHVPDRAPATMLALGKAFLCDAALALEAHARSERYRQLQQFDSIINDSADVIIMLDQNKRFRAWNRAAEHVFGWSAAEILGKHVSTIVPADILQAGELERIDREAERAGFCHLETERQTKDGRRVPVELTLSVLRDADGAPLGRSVILRDITARKRNEEARLRTERLATIGAMSAKLAHEIRNPLSSVLLNLDLVYDEIETLAQVVPQAANEARALLRSLESEIRRVQRVTEDYLQFARLPTPLREPTALNDVLRPGLAFMQSLFDAARVKLACDFAPDLPTVPVDETQLWQAILNIIRNALDAMPGGGTLTVRTARAGGEVLLAISDTGRGMTPLEQQNLFKPFFSTKPGGTGLGLPLTQQIVAEHGGRIECQSIEGRGTTFLLYLPVDPGCQK